MHWTLIAPFARPGTGRWLDAFLPATSAHRFTIVPARYAHDSSRSQTSRLQWKDYAGHTLEGWRQASVIREKSGVVTCFPQLALTTGLRKAVALRKLPLIAWTFNLGVLPSGVQRRAASFGLKFVNRIVVHSTGEIAAYSDCFGLPRGRFEFVPLQAPHRQITEREEESQPFLLAMGSARRDYALLFEVLEKLAIPTVVVAGSHALAGLRLPSCVTVRSGLTEEECYALLQRARLHVIPIDNPATASGQVTLLNSMVLGRPTVVTRCMGTVDYARDREDVLFVPSRNATALFDAIREAWSDAELRSRLGRSARARAKSEYSDSAVGARLEGMLNEFL